MGNLNDLNITENEPGKFSSNLGTAHEYLATGILMRLGFDVHLASVKGGPVDLIINVYRNGKDSENKLIRAQTRTCDGGLKFIAGIRAGTDRTYRSDVKKYKYTEKHNDLIIGVSKKTMDLYLVPTKCISYLGESISTKKLLPVKNNWDLLLNWNERFISHVCQQLTSHPRACTESKSNQC